MERKCMKKSRLQSTVKFLITLCVFQFMFSSCIKSKNTECVDKYNIQINQYKDNVIMGDTVSYCKLTKLLKEQNRIPELYSYSLIMANQYHFPRAYYDVYLCLINAYDMDINNMDSILIHFVKTQIEMGAKLNDMNCINLIDSINRNNRKNSKVR